MSTAGPIGPDEATAYLTAAEVAEVFRVRPSTVAKWANRGHLGCIRTLGGHRRYRRDDIDAWLDGRPPQTGGPAQTEKPKTG
ncbi:helix-turn-helix domain-containing protein [Streptomonospora sp. PA3]|uniref:BldC family transcriptional regulator n=1 Tax=Streptomonospora sp. PA3 TaxID=2607326 RepID=UPI0012DC474F|nr:BldC family transcriptional regulator [Streptomonospora sp. PA3]MUL41736.1 helix-turn-helix domain-containing protein [Streptomonospora sp. PA3]